MKQIIFSFLLLCLVARSKEEEQVVSQCRDGLISPSEVFMKDWEQKKIQPKPVVTKKAPQSPTPGAGANNSRPVPLPKTPPTKVQPSDMFEPLPCRSVVWSVNPNKYIPHDVINFPQNRIDSFCMGHDYQVNHKPFGLPQGAAHDTWSYTGIKEKISSWRGPAAKFCAYWLSKWQSKPWNNGVLIN